MTTLLVLWSKITVKIVNFPDLVNFLRVTKKFTKSGDYCNSILKMWISWIMWFWTCDFWKIVDFLPFDMSPTKSWYTYCVMGLKSHFQLLWFLHHPQTEPTTFYTQTFFPSPWLCQIWRPLKSYCRKFFWKSSCNIKK